MSGRWPRRALRLNPRMALDAPAQQGQLRRVLTPPHLLGIAAGLVISGDFAAGSVGADALLAAIHAPR